MLLHSFPALSTIPRQADAADITRNSLAKLVATMRKRLRSIAALVVAGGPLLLAACATPPADPGERAEFDKTNDPFEPLNREIFDFNFFLDRTLLRPVAVGYRTVLPEFSRTAIRNFLKNLGEPVIFANNMMQGQFKRADATAGRFFMNSVFGLGGVMDVASKHGLPRESGDFGQTLYSWGVPDGPYLVLPIFGPSNPRDAIGMGVDGYMDPWGYLASDYGAGNSATYGRYAATGIDERERNIETLDDLQRNAIDFYAQLRSLFRQHRASELRHGEAAPLPDMDELQ
jgi:phospholipid-binding lipoprotein MlaA